MAPRTRSNRAEKLGHQRMIALGQPINTVGLPALPAALILLVISFLPACQIPERVRNLRDSNAASRHKTLLALTMTCRTWRKVCLPFLWQRAEARAGMEGVDNLIPSHGGQHWSKSEKTVLQDRTLTREALRQLETVTVREPSYAVHVNVINIDLVYSIDTLLKELLDCLELLPRLHTVRLKIGDLSGRSHQRAEKLLAAWRPKKPLVSIKNWYSSEFVSSLIAFCPNLIAVGGLLYDFLELGRLQRLIEQPIPSVERFDNVHAFSFTKLTDVAAKFPNVRYIGWAIFDKLSVDPNRGYGPFGQALSPFEKLDAITLRPISCWWPGDDATRESWASRPATVLKAIQETDKRVKRVRLEHLNVEFTKTSDVYDLVIPRHGPSFWEHTVVTIEP